MLNLPKSSESPSPLGARVRRHDAKLAMRGRVMRGVTVVDVVHITQPNDAALDIVVTVARDLAGRGYSPCITFHRDQVGEIDGITLAREVA